MKALQYIYTSWKNGDSAEKGYMIYSKSEGITDEECTAIKDAMQYMAPKELTFTPTPEEIADIFPYSFACFTLPGGRGCVAQSTYLGRDYSGRFGNYIIYALVFDKSELPCRPAEMFAEDYIKTFMTEEELNAPSPVPPLPALEIDNFGSVINDDQINEFLFDKEETFAKLISYMLKARESGIPFYLNDTRENLVLWAAAVQRALPACIASNFAFNTYVGQHEVLNSQKYKSEGIDFYITGVRPDANFFNYETEYRSSNHIVMDFLGGYFTEGIETDTFSKAMAASMAFDFEEADSFGSFIEETSFREINGGLKTGYLYYKLLRENEIDLNAEDVCKAINFGKAWANEKDNSDMGCKLLVLIQESGLILEPKDLCEFWDFICKYSEYMEYTLYDFLLESVYQYVCDNKGGCEDILGMLNSLRSSYPAKYSEFLKYQNTDKNVDKLLLYLSGHGNINTNRFYVLWLTDSYRFSGSSADTQPITKLFNILLKNICAIPDSEEVIKEILLKASSSRRLMEYVLNVFMNDIGHNNSRMNKLCSSFTQKDSEHDDKTAGCIQMMLEIPISKPFAIRLAAQSIASAKKPEDEFWFFYNKYESLISKQLDFSAAPMVKACLKNLDKPASENFVFDMLKNINEQIFGDEAVSEAVINAVEECSVKSLIKTDYLILKRAYNLCENVNIKTDKLSAVLYGMFLQNNRDGSPVKTGLSRDRKRPAFKLNNLDKADYEAYLKSFYEAYFYTVYSKADMRELLHIFYHRHCFTSFINDITSSLKKLKKRAPDRWNTAAAWLCICVLNADKRDRPENEMYIPLCKMLKSYDSADLTKLKQIIRRSVPNKQCEAFFAELERKEGLSEKIGGFFRKK